MGEELKGRRNTTEGSREWRDRERREESRGEGKWRGGKRWEGRRREQKRRDREAGEGKVKGRDAEEEKKMEESEVTGRGKKRGDEKKEWSIYEAEGAQRFSVIFSHRRSEISFSRSHLNLEEAILNCILRGTWSYHMNRESQGHKGLQRPLTPVPEMYR